ncbi:hypothetical protein LZ554_005499 [Drepanopeziza brunnea f. sp. 'monogermtubi']|nr:hypothetical protein LZ554_005499 [Drepanopeziza brunnea f. sp. 'monogermtubi']
MPSTTSSQARRHAIRRGRGGGGGGGGEKSKYRPRVSCTNVCIAIFALLVVTITPIFLLAIRPYHRAIAYENAYFKELQRLDELEDKWQRHRPDDHLPDTRRRPLAYNNRTLPLVHDIPQLTSWDFGEQLELNADGTARRPDREVWIYVGGTTPTNDNWLDRISLYRKPNGSCVASADICTGYNEGFNTLIEHYHVDRGIDHGGKRTSSNAFFTFMDCDVSPMLCDMSKQRPVTLLHLKTMQPCRMDRDLESDSVTWSCSVRWSSVGLPLVRMPFKKSQVIAGHVVPVFPTAYEQMHAMVSWDGSLEGIGAFEDDYDGVVEVTVDLGDEAE